MNTLLYVFIAMAALAGILASVGIWSPRKLWVKTGALLALALFLPVAYAGFADLLSRPKPLHLEWQPDNLAEATVLGVDLREGEAIFLWLRVEGLPEPRAYRLDWNQERAEQLFSAQRTAEAEGTEVRIKQPSEAGDDDREPQFYALPQPPLPPKQPPSFHAGSAS